MKLLLINFWNFISNISLLIMLFLLCTCSNVTTKRIVLTSELLNVTDMIEGRPLQIDVLSNYLLIKNIDKDTYFTLVNLDNPRKQIFKTGYRGQGPGEIANAGPFFTDERGFTVLNEPSKQLLSFHLDSIINMDKYIPNKQPITLEFRPIINLTKLNKSYYVVNEVSFRHRFGLVDSLGKDMFRFGEFPEEAIDTKNNPFHVNNVAYQSELTSNNNRSTIAAATRYGEYVEFIYIDTENERTQLINRYIGSLPEYDNEDINGVPNFVLNDKSTAGYLSITSDDSYVYALYSGKIIRSSGPPAYISNTVQVFNWEGDFIHEFKLDKEVSYITLDKNILYGLYETARGYDIAKFSINLEE